MNNSIGCLSMYPMMGILIVSKFRLFQIKLLWTFTCKSLYDSHFLLDKCLEMEWLAYTNCQFFLKWLYCVMVLWAVYRSPTSSISSPQFGLVILFSFMSCSMYVLVSHCSHNLHSSNNIEYLFMHLFAICVSFLVDCFNFFCPF